MIQSHVHCTNIYFSNTCFQCLPCGIQSMHPIAFHRPICRFKMWVYLYCQLFQEVTIAFPNIANNTIVFLRQKKMDYIGHSQYTTATAILYKNLIVCWNKNTYARKLQLRKCPLENQSSLLLRRLDGPPGKSFIIHPNTLSTTSSPSSAYAVLSFTVRVSGCLAGITSFTILWAVKSSNL